MADSFTPKRPSSLKNRKTTTEKENERRERDEMIMLF
jgi:hypothetical protein